jgi:small multidrug resistance pump
LKAELAVFFESEMPEKLVPWILLFAAILLEVAGITSMKLSRGFTEPVPSLAVPIFYVCSAAAVILALKHLSITYAIWSGVGTALAAMIGIAYFREPLTFFKMASLALVVIGVIGLSLAARQSN